MGQVEVLDYLKRQRMAKNEEYFTARELMKELNASLVSISRQLNRLYMYGFVEMKPFNMKERRYRYRIKV